ncbi:MAG: hypothetical protein V3T70_07010, partial [Phycisphaerae bacterium]
LVLLSIAAWHGRSAYGQPQDRTASEEQQLAARQRFVRDRIAELEDRMFKLADVLRQTDPGQAERLKAAFVELRDRMLRRRMAEVADLLEAGRFSDATESQSVLSQDLEQLLRILLNDADDFDQQQARIERLRRMRQALERIIDEQARQRAEALNAARMLAELNRLSEAAERVGELLDRQENAAQENERDRQPTDDVQSETAEQRDIRKDTERLAGALNRGKQPGGTRTNPDDQSSERSTDSDNAPTAESGDSADGKQQGEQPDSSQQNTREGASQEEPSDQQPLASGTPPAADPSAASESQTDREQDWQDDAAAALQRAAERMGDAEEALSRADRPAAGDAQNRAASELRNMLHALSEEMNAVESALDMDRQAQAQKALGDRTARLLGEMEGERPSDAMQPTGDDGERAPSDDENGDPSSPSKPGAQSPANPNQGAQPSAEGEQPSGAQSQSDSSRGQSSGEPRESEFSRGSQDSRSSNESPRLPGQPHVQKALPHQRQAQEQLDNERAEQAADSQKKALQQLETARAELEEVLEQMRREQQEEMLASLQARFQAMLTRQLDVNAETSRLDELGRDQWTRSDQLALAETADHQQWVAQEAGRSSRILTEEGTTIVFPELVAGIQEDAAAAADRLAMADTGDSVRAIQLDVAETLKEMLDSVEQRREQMAGGGGEGESGETEIVLLPPSAELKMLRSRQLRVNRATRLMEERRVLPDTNFDELEQDMRRTAARQAALARLAKSLDESRAAAPDASE